MWVFASAIEIAKALREGQGELAVKLTTGHRVLMAEGWLGLAGAGLDRPAYA